jgi:hypothetical protein
MDTSTLPVEGVNFTDAELHAVQRGARVAAELLRAMPPERVVLTRTLPKSDVPVQPLESAIAAHVGPVVFMSHPAMLERCSPGWPELTQEHLDTMAFCSAFEVVRYAILRTTEGEDWESGPGWMDGHDCDVYALATNVACIASGFRFIASDSANPDEHPLTDVVEFFCRRLHDIRQAEGQAALWRGAVGLAARDLVREVRFSILPGQVSMLGQPLRSLTDVLTLVDYYAGTGPWPFPMRSGR